jgi:hypothetical protein
MTQEILAAFDAGNWYAVLALVLFAVLQAWRNAPVSSWLWAKIPEGLRWLPPVAVGAVVGFTDAYFEGVDWRAALLRAVAGIVYVSLPAMGARGLMREVQQRDAK